MPSYNWPRIGDDCPQDIAKHASCLKNDFDRVSKAVDLSLSPSRSATLPSTLEPSILTGIEKGIAEARNKGYCPAWSKVDEIIFRNVMLKNIATEAALQIRDRIPLDQFNGLHKSYNALHTKLVAQLPPTATSHQSVRVDASIQATSVDNPVEASNGTNAVVEMVQASRQSVNSPREKKDQDVAEKKGDNNSEEEDKSGEGQCEEKESGEGESEEEESEEEQIKKVGSKQEERKHQDAEDGQALPDSEDSETGSHSSEDGSSDSSSGAEESEDDGESDSDADCDNDQVQEIVKENTARRALKDSAGSSTIFKLEIQDQATVNRMEDMESSELLRSITCSLKDHLGEKQLSSAGVHISAASLLDSGDVNVAIYQNKHVGPSIISDLKGWDQRLERTLIGSHVPTYKVLVYSVRTKSLVFRNRKEKSMIIRKLTDANRSIGDKDSVKPIIRDIYWAGNSSIKAKALATLIVEFMDSKQANQALLRGLSWQEWRYGCDRADKKSKLLRCGRCQAYGHLMADCLAPYCCGTCSGEHSTWTCNSKIRKCGSCGGDHRAGDNRCPEKIKAKKDSKFTNEDTPRATKPATKAVRTPPSVAQRSTSAGTTQTKASMPSPVSLDAESDDVESEPKQPLPEVEMAEHNVKSKSKQPLPEVEMSEENLKSGSKQSLPEVEVAKNNVEFKSKQPLPQAETVEDNVESKSNQSLPQADSPQDTSAELATLRQMFEDIEKKFVALDAKMQSMGSGGTKRRADEAFVNGAGAESSGVAAKRIKKEEPTYEEDSMSLYRQPSVYSVNRPE